MSVDRIIYRVLQPGDKVTGEPGLFVDFKDGQPQTMWCPKCGKAGQLGDHHVDVLRSGEAVTITPSLICPREGCGAHYWVKAGKVEWC